MAINVLITLSVIDNPGPFDLYYSTSGTTGPWTLLENDVPLSSFSGSGYLVSVPSDLAKAIKVVSDGYCTNEESTLIIGTPNDICLCPIDFTPLPDDSGCVFTAITAATQVIFLSAGTGASNVAYGDFGVRIYNPTGFTSQGLVIGTYDYEGLDIGPTTPTNIQFWMGRMNLTDIWVDGNSSWPSPSAYPGSISVCDTINVNETKQYYVGIAGDNDVTIQINNTIFVDQPDNEPSDNFKYWHIYPITLNQGQNIITLIGTNRSSVGAFAAEIYDNTLSELTAATATTMVTRIFTTEDFRFGGPRYQQAFCSNFSCPTGFVYDDNSGQCFSRIDLPCLSS